jgi:hypothetical protein
MSDDKQKLEPLTNKEITNRYLKFAVDFREPISCILEASKIFFRAQAVSWIRENLQLEILPPSYDLLTPEAKAELSQSGTKLALSFSVSELMVICYSDILRRKDRKLELEIQFPLLKLQRRSSLRLKVGPGHGATLTLSGNKFALYDVGAGGLSIVIGPEELEQFPPDQVLAKCRLRFLGQEASLQLIPKSRTESKKNGRWKIGLKFVDLPQQIENLIMREAYLENQNMWKRGNP